MNGHLFTAPCEVLPEVVQTEPELVAPQRRDAQPRYGNIVVLQAPPLLTLQARNFRLHVNNPNGRAFFVSPLKEGQFAFEHGTAPFCFDLVLRTRAEADRERDALRRVTVFGDADVRAAFIQHVQAFGGVVKTFEEMEVVDVKIARDSDFQYQCCSMRMYANEIGNQVINIENAQGETIFIQEVNSLTLTDIEGEHQDQRHAGTFFVFILRLPRRAIHVPIEGNADDELEVFLTFIGKERQHAFYHRNFAEWGATMQARRRDA